MEQTLPFQERLNYLTHRMDSSCPIENAGIISFCAGNEQKIYEASFNAPINANINKYKNMACRLLNSGKPICDINSSLADIPKADNEAFDAFAASHNNCTYIFFIVTEVAADKVYMQNKKLSAQAFLFDFFHTEAEKQLQNARNKVGNAEKHLLEYSKISHDFKTPINIIQASIQLLELKLIKMDEPLYESTYKQIISMAQANIFKLSRLTNNFLDCVRAENGAMELLLSYESIVECADKAIGQMRALAAEKQIQLVIKSKINIYARFVFDTIKLERILLNLISNSITSIVESENGKGKITVLIDEDENYIILSVTDNGKGVPEHNADKIFDSFYSLNKKGGSGLGLSIAKAMAELHNGSVVLKRLKRGSRFTVRLSKNINSNEDRLLSAAVDYSLHTTDEFVTTELAYLNNYFSE